MQQIKMLKDYKNYLKDEVYSVNANEAHSLIDGGYAKLYNISKKSYEDKAMRPTFIVKKRS